MAIRKNPDGSVTVGILPDEKDEKKVEGEPKKSPSAKKPTKKKEQ